MNRAAFEVVNYFDDNPVNLFRYVECGLKIGKPIVTAHVFQLAKMLGVPLEPTDEIELNQYPDFVNPACFANINKIMVMGRRLAYS